MSYSYTTVFMWMLLWSFKGDDKYHVFKHLMHFLIGLSDRFDHIRNQILVMEPLPTANKTYSMLLRVEKQMDVQASIACDNSTLAMFVKGHSTRKPTEDGYRKKKNTKKL